MFLTAIENVRLLALIVLIRSVLFSSAYAHTTNSNGSLLQQKIRMNLVRNDHQHIHTVIIVCSIGIIERK